MNAHADPLTRSFGGSASSKDLAIVLVIVVVIGGAIWLLWRKTTASIAAIPDAATKAVVGIPDVIWSAGRSNIEVINTALAMKQEAAATGFSEYVDSLPGAQQWAVEAGTGLLPSAIISAEVQAGSQFAAELEMYGDRARFEELPVGAKQLVILGQAITMPLGLDPYAAGKAARQRLDSLFGG